MEMFLEPTFRSRRLENLMEVVLDVSLVDAHLEFHSLKLIFKSNLTEGTFFPKLF